jgi:S-adenosylmethionine:tRNA ribosyltransferase-isomerase
MDDFDYELPPELIAQVPLAQRDASRLMTVDRATSAIRDHTFKELPDLLRPGDLLVVNDSRVIPARLFAHKETGGQAELLLLRKEQGARWLALARPVRRLKPGTTLQIEARTGALFAEGHAVIEEIGEDGQVIVRLDEAVAEHLERFGHAPLPPYIHQRLDDEERYQTVYSAVPGSAAAPTAGLHFTDAVLRRLEERGIERVSVTLHVGLDTFRPVTESFAEEHKIHAEWCTVSDEVVARVLATKDQGGRVVAVGTTAARTLETLGRRLAASETDGFSAMTDIYITPGYAWTMVDALVTNFHLPRSTLLLMISSFTGRDLTMRAYRHAIEERYRFFSFGDAMLIT